MPRWPLVASIPLSLVNLITRVAILPVLALALDNPPAMGPMILGSFALLYSQLVLPTPSGAGAVELGFLGGAAGDLGDGQAWLLLAWRLFARRSDAPQARRNLLAGIVVITLTGFVTLWACYFFDVGRIADSDMVRVGSWRAMQGNRLAHVPIPMPSWRARGMADILPHRPRLCFDPDS